MELEEKIEIIKEAQNKVEGDITVHEYIKIKDDNEWPSIPKLTKGIKWNELKNLAFDKEYRPRGKWTVKEAIENYKKAQNYHGKKKLFVREYDEYVENHGGPSSGFIMNRYRWVNFRKLVKGEDIEIGAEREKDRFCNLCLEQDDCYIKIENCEYWREWNENQQQNFG